MIFSRTAAEIHRPRRERDFDVARFEKLKVGDACLSVITYGELLYGARKSKQRDVALARLAGNSSL
jgi:predicted nucleic acid-binding protein